MAPPPDEERILKLLRKPNENLLLQGYDENKPQPETGDPDEELFTGI